MYSFQFYLYDNICERQSLQANTSKLGFYGNAGIYKVNLPVFLHKNFMGGFTEACDIIEGVTSSSPSRVLLAIRLTERNCYK